MAISFTAIGVALFLLLLFFLFLRQKTVTDVDGSTITFRQLWREEAAVEYSEPSGLTLEFSAHWSGWGTNQKSVLSVEFPAELFVLENKQLRKQEAIEHLDIPETSSVMLTPIQRDEVKERISRGLKNLKIAHEFFVPQRSGWTSFEDGKEIYHG